VRAAVKHNVPAAGDITGAAIVPCARPSWRWPAGRAR